MVSLDPIFSNLLNFKFDLIRLGKKFRDGCLLQEYEKIIRMVEQGVICKYNPVFERKV